MPSHTAILLGSLSTKQIRPSFIGLQRDSPPHEKNVLFRTSNRDIINECCSHFCFKLPSEILPARFDRFLCKLQQQLRL